MRVQQKRAKPIQKICCTDVKAFQFMRIRDVTQANSNNSGLVLFL
jgi:hypothetical protein